MLASIPAIDIHIFDDRYSDECFINYRFFSEHKEGSAVMSSRYFSYKSLSFSQKGKSLLIVDLCVHFVARSGSVNTSLNICILLL